MYHHFPFQNVMIQSQNRGSLQSTTSFTTEVDQGEPRLFGEAPQQHYSPSVPARVLKQAFPSKREDFCKLFKSQLWLFESTQ